MVRLVIHPLFHMFLQRLRHIDAADPRIKLLLDLFHILALIPHRRAFRQIVLHHIRRVRNDHRIDIQILVPRCKCIHPFDIFLDMFLIRL